MPLSVHFGAIVPSSRWKRVRLSEVVTLQRGHDLPAQDRTSGPIPIIGSFGVTGSHNVARYPGPGVTIGRSGSIGNATYTAGPYWPLNTSLFVSDFRGNDPRWVYWLLHSIDFTAYNSGSVQPSLNRNFLTGIAVDLPPLDQQRRIAEVLGACDDLIDSNKRTLQSTEALLQAHFEAMSFDSPGGVALADRVDLNPNYSKPKGIAPYVDMAALPTDSFFIEEVSSRPAAGGARFMRDDVLLARITPCLENGKAAFAANLVPGEVYVGSTEFIVMRSKQGVSPSWPYFLARSERFREYAIRHMTGSSGRQRLAATSLESYEVGGNSDALLEFDRLASTLLDAASQLSTENAELRRTRDELLPLLMSGAVRVRPEEVAA